MAHIQARLPLIAACLGSALALGACERASETPWGRPGEARSLADIRRTGTLRVATRNAPTTYYLDRRTQPVGPEHDLVRAFAASLGLEVEFVVADSTDGVLRALMRGKADLAAAGLTATARREAAFAFGPSYREVHEQLVCHRGDPVPEDLASLGERRVAVAAGTSYAEGLDMRAAERPALRYETADVGTEQLLARVADGELDCTVADSHIVAMNRRYFPDLEVAFDIDGPARLVWMLPQDAHGLRVAVEDWFAGDAAQAALAQVQHRYFALAGRFDYLDALRFGERVDARLPDYLPWFERAAERHDLAPELLAAVAYQESQWDPDAVSPTGVRGLMMLTERTAASVGVEDRTDPRESILGGARYIARMKARFDDAVPEPDRTWLALAAYNIGRAHVHDAQALARRNGLDPHRWADVKAMLPRLADPDVHPTLKYGYARGTAPVHYVEQVRHYTDVLERELAG